MLIKSKGHTHPEPKHVVFRTRLYIPGRHFRVVVRMGARRVQLFSKFQLGKFFSLLKIYLS